jgi:polyhydroxyalkanoate synthesis regulator protein
VVAGVRVKVIEDKTHADITRVILLQVIADQEQFGRRSFLRRCSKR